MRLSISSGLSISGTTSGTAVEDTTAPTADSITAGTQEADGDVPITVTNLSENATAYFSVTTSDQSAAAAAAVKTAGGGGAGLTDQVDAGTFSVTVGGGPYTPAITTGLSGNHYIQIVFEDASANLSTVYADGPVVIDTTAPGITSYSPADNATSVATNAPLVIVFNESMKTTGTSATVTLKNVGGATIETFDPDVDGAWSTTTNTNDTWTVSPASSFSGGATLAVQYSGFEDDTGNVVAAVSDDTTWNFTAATGVTNLLSDTEDLTAVSWTTDTAGGAVTASSSDTAPDSGADACRHYNTDTATNGILQAVTLSAGSHNFSIYAKGNGTNLYLRMNIDGAQAWFDLNTITSGANSGGAANVTITDEGSGWRRCSFSFTATAGSKNALFLAALTGNGSTQEIVGDGTTNYLNLWGAQLTAGATTLETYTAN